ncbi:MAG: hypothetical protein H6996_07050 [Moraxellaceae bacterium]|nr:hypothetical protein [Moraxellaceae bacterium]
MSKFGFLELAHKILQEENKPLSVEEMWQLAIRKGYDTLLGSNGKTPERTLGARIYVDMQNNIDSIFDKVSTRPTRFALKNRKVIESDNVVAVINDYSKNISKNDFLEKDLHPLLSYFASVHLKVYTKTIRHHTSDKKEFGEWVHPDIVGCYFPLEDWQPDVFELSTVIGNTSLRFYSFELKRELNLNNLRESFFQTVSNSSWANESYLVAAHVSTNEDFRDELSRLSTSFGIGVIALDIQEPDASEIIYPALRKENLDWDMLNKLSSMNNDFKSFLKRIRNDVQSKEIRKEWYDKVLPVDDIIASFTKKI